MATADSPHPTTRTNLSPQCQRFVALMQRLNYGSIEDLHVLNGEPVLDPPPRRIREVKFARENGPRPEVAKADFALKAEVIDLFAQLEAIGDGVITRIEIQRGLPFRMTFEEAYA